MCSIEAGTWKAFSPCCLELRWNRRAAWHHFTERLSRRHSFPPEAPRVSLFRQSLILLAPHCLIEEAGMEEAVKGTCPQNPPDLAMYYQSPGWWRQDTVWLLGWFAHQMVQHLTVTTFLKGWCRQFFFPESIFFLHHLLLSVSPTRSPGWTVSSPLVSSMPDTQ